MTVKNRFKTLFNYHWDTTGRLIDCAAGLDLADYQERPDYGHGSIHNLLFHLLQTASGWRIGLESGKQQTGIEADDYPDLDTLQAAFDQERAAWDRMLGGYSDSDIAGDVDLINWRGDPYTFPLWRVLQHLILHGMQHHSELAALLTAKGQSPGGLDFIFYGG